MNNGKSLTFVVKSYDSNEQNYTNLCIDKIYQNFHKHTHLTMLPTNFHTMIAKCQELYHHHKLQVTKALLTQLLPKRILHEPNANLSKDYYVQYTKTEF